MKKGFTLMELVVYMAIVGIVVLVAGQAFSNSTKFRVRTQNMLKSTAEAENVANLFKADVSQMGAKSSKEAGNADGGESYGDKFSEVNENVYMDPNNSDATKRDSSSFFIAKKDDGNDSLLFRRMRYDASGHYEAVEEIGWYVKDRKLMRSCRLVAKKAGFSLSDDDPCAAMGKEANVVAMTEADSEGFVALPATPNNPADDLDDLGDEQIFPPNGNDEFRLVSRFVGETDYESVQIQNASGERNEGGSSQTLSGFYSNYDAKTTVKSDVHLNQVFVIRNESAAQVTDSWRNNCENYGLKKGDGTDIIYVPEQEYEISFTIPAPTSDEDKILSFVPGKDHFSVGFRSASNGEIPKKNGVPLVDDFLFYPPLATGAGIPDGKHAVRFTVPDTLKKACVAFTFVFYSPLVAMGNLTIEDFRIRKLANRNRFEEGFDAKVENRKFLKQRIKAIRLSLVLKRKGETGNAILVVPIPSNGPSD